ncbi:MAG: hypothetical protein ABW123_11710, partial [Cystobacter sp.]
MKSLTYTLVADGTSDRCLMHVINWALAQHVRPTGSWLITSEFADYKKKPDPPKSLSDRLRQAALYHPCDVLFVHRDAEREAPFHRRTEILDAATEAGIKSVVCIVPVRMTEAWMLIDESAIRHAAGNP